MKNEQEFGRVIAKLLNDNAETTLKQSTLYRLQLARRAALDNCRPAEKIVSTGNGISAYARYGSQHSGKLLLLTIVFVLLHIGFSQMLDHDKNAQIDTMLLADDLPVDAFIDNEFEEWLNLD